MGFPILTILIALPRVAALACLFVDARGALPMFTTEEVREINRRDPQAPQFAHPGALDFGQA